MSNARPPIKDEAYCDVCGYRIGDCICRPHIGARWRFKRIVRR